MRPCKRSCSPETVSYTHLKDKVSFTEETLVSGGIKTPYYRLVFADAKTQWTYRIDAVLGTVLEKQQKETATTAIDTAEFSSLEEAKKIALKDAGLDEATQKIVFTREEMCIRDSQIPVPANENVSFFLIQLAEESVDYVTQCYIIYAALNIIGCRNALLQLCAEFAYKCAAFQSVAVTAAIQRNVTSDPSKERIQIASWLMRWNGVPRFHVSIVFTFFGCLLVIDYSTCLLYTSICV